jgi:hypothetical protein
LLGLGRGREVCPPPPLEGFWEGVADRVGVGVDVGVGVSLGVRVGADVGLGVGEAVEMTAEAVSPRSPVQRTELGLDRSGRTTCHRKTAEAPGASCIGAGRVPSAVAL